MSMGMPPMMGGCMGGGCMMIGYGGGGCGKGGGMGGGMYSSPDEERFYTEIATALEPFLHLEKEWDAEKFRKKMVEYFNKAHKGVTFSPNSWEKKHR